MTEDVHSLLMAHDHPDPAQWEAPPDFLDTERETLLVKVRTLAHRIEERLGVPVNYDDGYQDASCVVGLYIKADQGEQAVIRFSSFGQMAVIFWWAEGARLPLRTPLEAELLPLVQQGGFQVVPPEVLARPYDGLYGVCVGTFNNPMSWFERYFDYL